MDLETLQNQVTELQNQLATLESKFERLNFQFGWVVSGLDLDEHGTAIFFRENDWGEEEWDLIADVFDRYSSKLVNAQTFNYSELEKDLADTVGINYQGVKSLVSTHYNEGRWTEVCYQYAKSMGDNPPIGMQKIITDYEGRIA